MHSLSYLITLLFAVTATSAALPGPNVPSLSLRQYSNSTTGVEERPLAGTCSRMRRLDRFMQFASNQTKLDAWTEKGILTPERIEKIKTKAASAATELKELQSNATLVSECAVVNAGVEDSRKCVRMAMLGKLTDMAGNETAVAEFTARKGLSEELVAKLKGKIEAAEKKLEEMKGNATLTALCEEKKKELLANIGGGGAAAAAAGGEAAATGNAARLNMQTMPWVVVPAVAGLFTLFL